MKFFARFQFFKLRRKTAAKIGGRYKIAGLSQVGHIRGVIFAKPIFRNLGRDGRLDAWRSRRRGASVGRYLAAKFWRIKNTEFRVKVFRQARVINRARAYRRGASRVAVAGGSKDSGDGGSESDSGDPPGPGFSFPVALFQKIYRKSNSLLFPWRVLPVLAWQGRSSGCWRLLCHARLIEEVAA